jgi:prevent-host-death family protein
MTSHFNKPVPSWSVQDAKARFSEFLDAATTEGPQVVTRRGVETAVLVPIEEWRRLSDQASAPGKDRPTLKELLLSDPRRFDLDIPPRGQWKHRPPIDLE